MIDGVSYHPTLTRFEDGPLRGVRVEIAWSHRERDFEVASEVMVAGLTP